MRRPDVYAYRITYSNGYREFAKRAVGGYWSWDGGYLTSRSVDELRRAVERSGGQLEMVPNPTWGREYAAFEQHLRDRAAKAKS